MAGILRVIAKIFINWLYCSFSSIGDGKPIVICIFKSWCFSTTQDLQITFNMKICHSQHCPRAASVICPQEWGQRPTVIKYDVTQVTLNKFFFFAIGGRGTRISLMLTCVTSQSNFASHAARGASGGGESPGWGLRWCLKETYGTDLYNMSFFFLNFDKRIFTL